MGWLIKTTGSRTMVIHIPHARLPARNNGSNIPDIPIFF